MDNFRINILCEGKDTLVAAMRIAFRHKNTRAISYRVDRQKGLIFYQYATTRSGVVSLPFKLDAEGAADFAARWLAEVDYGCEPDHDGDNGKGWCLYNEDWGFVNGEHEAFVAVKPAWALYGK